MHTIYYIVAADGGFKLKYITVHPKGRLEGKITVQGSKNSALPIMAAALLNRGFTIIKNCPRITDVDCMALLLTDAGCNVFWQNDMLIIDAKNAAKTTVNKELAGKIRASILLMGAFLGRFGEGNMPLPGGCKIGKRPIDMHIEAMEKLGASCTIKDGCIDFSTLKMTGNRIAFRSVSVGATENALLASVLADGVTVIENAAVEPEVIEFCEALVNMGADIRGIGTKELVVTGVDEFFDSVYEVKPDRIVLGTYIGAVAIAGGNVEFDNCNINQAYGYIDAFYAMGIKCRNLEPLPQKRNGGILVSMQGRPKPVNCIKTEPHPGFPTDMQPIAMSVLSIAQGESMIIENVFENRLSIAQELRKMGADITVEGNKAIICGQERLRGETVAAGDLRASAALLVAAVAAQGDTIIKNIEYILRGYEDVCRDFLLMGADVTIGNG